MGEFKFIKRFFDFSIVLLLEIYNWFLGELFKIKYILLYGAVKRVFLCEIDFDFFFCEIIVKELLD